MAMFREGKEMGAGPSFVINHNALGHCKFAQNDKD